MGKVFLHWFKLGFVSVIIFSVGFTIIMLYKDLGYNRDPLLLGITIIFSSLGIGIQVGFIGLIVHLISTRKRNRSTKRIKA